MGSGNLFIKRYIVSGHPKCKCFAIPEMWSAFNLQNRFMWLKKQMAYSQKTILFKGQCDQKHS